LQDSLLLGLTIIGVLRSMDRRVTENYS